MSASNLEKALLISNRLFDVNYDTSNGYTTYHFSFLFCRNRLLSVGQNDYRTLPKPGKMTYNLNRYWSLHSEVDAISKLWGRKRVGKNTRLVNIRIARGHRLRLSKPCKNCQALLDKLKVTKIWYSTNDGGFKRIRQVKK